MANTYWWYISEMNCKPKDGDLTDFVVTVHWNRLATDGTFNGRVYGSQNFSSKDVADFIPYNELTYDIVCGWLDNTLDVPELDLNLAQQIEIQVNPPIITLPLPFENPPAPVV